MKQTVMIAVLLCCAGFLSAQDNNATASVFFETDQYALSEKARKTLDDIALKLLQFPDYQADIEAYTDDRGTADYNRELAANRAAAVQQYLAAKGLIADKATVKNWGEQKALGVSDQARQQSRRVDILINSFFFNDFFSLRERLSANTTQTLEIAPNKESVVFGARGTQVVVPANSFVFEDGTAPTTPVSIQLEEAYNPADFVLHNLTTSSNGQILQTGGMVRITAIADGRELQLAEGASLTVAIPNGGKFDPEMELFYAQTTENGGVDWKPAGQKFRKTLKPSSIELKIDPELGKRIASLKVEEYPMPSLPSYKGKMAMPPKAPVAPYKPRAPQKPEWDDMVRLFSGSAGGEMGRMNRKELKKAKAHYANLLKNYERDSIKYIELIARYQRNVEGYEKAKIRYAQDKKAWEQELSDRLRAIALYRREMSLHYYSKGLVLGLKIAGKHIQKSHFYANLHNAVDQLADEKSRYLMAKDGIMPPPGNTSKNTWIEKNLHEAIIGTQVIDHYPDFSSLSFRVNNNLPLDTNYRTTRRMLRATGIKVISDSLIAEIKEVQLKQSLASNDNASQVLNAYVASVGQLGWINCDRFYDDPAEKLQVAVKEEEEASFYVICKDISSMLSMYQTQDGRYIANNLPKGRKVTIVAIKIKDGMPMYARREMVVGEPALSNLEYKAMPLRELKNELQRLNS